MKKGELTRDVVRGQYTAGKVGNEDVPGYRQEQGVAPNSTTFARATRPRPQVGCRQAAEAREP